MTRPDAATAFMMMADAIAANIRPPGTGRTTIRHY